MLVSICLFAPLLVAGCVTKSKANAQARKAYIAGEKQGASTQLAGDSVWVVGNVRTPIIPWTADLTLAKAIMAANYVGATDPKMFVMLRNGQAPQYVSLQQILNGFDTSLEPGDKIEVRP